MNPRKYDHLRQTISPGGSPSRPDLRGWQMPPGQKLLPQDTFGIPTYGGVALTILFFSKRGGHSCRSLSRANGIPGSCGYHGRCLPQFVSWASLLKGFLINSRWGLIPRLPGTEFHHLNARWYNSLPLKGSQTYPKLFFLSLSLSRFILHVLYLVYAWYSHSLLFESLEFLPNPSSSEVNTNAFDMNSLNI